MAGLIKEAKENISEDMDDEVMTGPDRTCPEDRALRERRIRTASRYAKVRKQGRSAPSSSHARRGGKTDKRDQPPSQA